MQTLALFRNLSIKKYLFLLFISFSLASPLQAIEDNQDTVTIPPPPPPTTVANKGSVSTITSELINLQDSVNQINLASEKEKIDFPVNSNNISQKIGELDLREVSLDEQTQAVTVSDKLRFALDNLQSQEEDLEKYNTSAKQLESKINEIQQLLSNPLNQLGISPDDIQSLPSLLKQTQDLITTISTKQATLKEESEKVKTQSVLIEHWKNAVSKAYAVQSSKKIVAAKETEKDRLIELKSSYLEKAKEIQNKLINSQNYLNIEQIRTLHTELYFNETMAWLTEFDIELLSSFYSQTIRIAQDSDSLKNLNSKDLQKILDSVQKNISLLEQKKKEITARKEEFEKRNVPRSSQFDLTDAFNERELNIGEQLGSIQNTLILIKKIIDKKRKQAIYTQDRLYNIDNLTQGIKEVPNSLVLIGYQIKISFTALFHYMTEQLWRISVFVALLLISSLSVIFLTRFFVEYRSKVVKSSSFELMLIQNIKEIISVFRYRYIPIILFCSLIVAVKLSGISPPSDKIILLLSYLSLVQIIWHGSLSLALRKKSIRRRTSYQARASITLFCFFIALFLLSRYSSAPYFVTAIFEKFLFVSTAYFLWVTRSIIFAFLYDQNNKSIINKTLKGSINVMTWVTIFFILIGLADYNRLAWILIKYALATVLYLVILIYGINIINDFRKFSKLYCIKNFNHGAFIAQDIASPFSSILKILWLLAVTKVFFVLFQWNSDTFLISRVLDIANYTVINIGETTITPLRIILLIILLSMIFKVGRWFKSVSYRWIYSRINDLGIRTSLSIFTQYLIICIGLIITLNIIGIDLTSLAVFAGAIGVGVGLGLQDIAKNFISGILLLIERPLRTGDIVDINSIEGSVKRIGMRAITLETFDLKEVIIPNSGVISKEFTNWTHTDNILRTVLFVGAGYDSEPEHVIKTIKDIIAENTSILKDSGSDVIMWEFADSSINYRIHYFIDIEVSSLIGVRNAVLSKVWHRFREEGISCPFPQRDVHIKTKI